ncbi:HlyD family secretion protein [Paraburkholderia tropica]|uniref:Membrane fusion protein (Multidrug efflux system) n=1 Tax=Paraburkholderia tropica TaxID=92647 RepID=A0ABX5MSR7_9BURK|nr:HlyD family secretion protein [Paraburkholderia tropica]MDE1140057.1 HlyD family secretion protein [Paraburkholderia tropica]PXX17992.1 membrane fusion protein (multidrug efflux system) [Paraburkholderia tropica]PZW85974.1 membrane fusion protein (multidrug efflux system) [Paraburkholderia tropica]
MNDMTQPAAAAAKPSAPQTLHKEMHKETPPKKSRVPLVIGIAIVALFAGVAGWKIYAPSANVWTDDARITAHYTTIAPRVAGQIASVSVQDNQSVHAGQLLATLDDRDYRTAVERAQSQLDRDRAQVDDASASVARQPDVIAQNSAQVQQIEARLALAQSNATRYRNLAAFGSGSKQDTEAADATLREQSAQLAQARAAVSAAQHQLDLLKAQHEAAIATVHADEAALAQAQLNLSYTRIVAPMDGVVGERAVEPGNYVSPGAALMALVPAKGMYVEAQYREVALKHMQPGQHVRVHVDAYDIDLNGVVDSVPPSTGAVFAPIAPDNATGNFTKIVQRLPVKIVFAPDQPKADLLRLGMSVETTVLTDNADVVGKLRDTYHASDASAAGNTSAAQAAQAASDADGAGA